jgi:hypothetical protein
MTRQRRSRVKGEGGGLYATEEAGTTGARYSGRGDPAPHTC